MIKICKACGEEKDIDFFPNKKKNGKIYKRKTCLSCYNAKKRESYYKNIDTYRKYYKNNKEKKKKYSLDRYKKNKECISEYRKIYYKKNNKKLLSYNKKWYKKNSKLTIKYRDKNYKQRLAGDSFFRLIHYQRTRIGQIFRNINTGKTKSTIKYIGCTKEELKKHIESQFTEGMTWDNYGEWHVDHIRPCASFDLTKPEEQEKCFHYSNLQPLWAIDNLKKGAKIA